MSTPKLALRIEISPRTVIIVFGVIGAIWFMTQMTNVLTVVTVALVMVGTFDPVVAWFERLGVRRGRALVLVFLVATLAMIGLLVLMVPPLVSQLLEIIDTAPKARTNLIASLSEYSWAKSLVKAIKAVPIDDLVTRAASSVIGYSSHILAILGYAISTLFLAIYLLADPTGSKGFLYAITPRHHHVKLAKILLELKVIVGGYMRGQLITSLSIMVFVFVLLTIYDVENALAIALFAGMTDIIPFVGGYIASAPVIASVWGHGSGALLVVSIIMFVYQEFESRILVPRVYGHVLRLSPAIVLLALLIGGTLAGITGALLSLPIAAGLRMVVRELRVDLPGDSVPREETLARDERASELYEQLSEGVSPADAGAIADDLAKIMIKREHDTAEHELEGEPEPSSETGPVAPDPKLSDLPSDEPQSRVTRPIGTVSG